VRLDAEGAGGQIALDQGELAQALGAVLEVVRQVVGRGSADGLEGLLELMAETPLSGPAARRAGCS
jgi:hypothetical protein